MKVLTFAFVVKARDSSQSNPHNLPLIRDCSGRRPP